jgi:hypothetical protein
MRFWLTGELETGYRTSFVLFWYYLNGWNIYNIVLYYYNNLKINFICISNSMSNKVTMTKSYYCYCIVCFIKIKKRGVCYKGHDQNDATVAGVELH